MTTVGDCWRDYVSNHIQSTCRPDAQIAYWGRLLFFDGLDAGSLSSREVDRYIAQRKLVAKPGTINRELALLRACLRHSERRGLVDRAPYIKSLPKPPPKMRALSREEAGRMIKAAMEKGGWRDQVYMLLALGTGQRTGSILDLRWSGVHEDNQVIDFRTHTDDKSARMKRRVVIPMNDMTAKAISIASKHRKGDYVLHNEGKPLYSPREMVAKIAKWAGVKDVTPHVFRHTVASLLLQEGQDLLKVSRLLGHASTVITQQIYFQHPPSWLKETASLLKF